MKSVLPTSGIIIKEIALKNTIANANSHYTFFKNINENNFCTSARAAVLSGPCRHFVIVFLCSLWAAILSSVPAARMSGYLHNLN